jgi:lysophospholipase L1-like esterase
MPDMLAPLVVALLIAQAPTHAPEKAWEPTPRLREYDWMSVADWNARHEKLLEHSKQGGIDLLFLGDSITEGWADNPTWKARYAPRSAANFGIGGDTTQNVLWRLRNGEVEGLKPKVVVLLIGTNNFGLHDDPPDAVVRGIKAVLVELRKRLPETKVLLLGILPRDADPGTDLRIRIRETNAKLADFDDGHDIRFLDIGHALLEPDGRLSKEVMPDFLHLSEAGYARWAEAMEPVLAAMLAP